MKGVEYVYSQSSPEQAMIIVQFYVGEDIERSLVKLYNEIMKNMDQMPAGVTLPLIKTRSIDDVPVMSLTLWSEHYDDYQLKRVAQELTSEIEKITDVSETKLLGGRNREIQVVLDPDKMAVFKSDPLLITQQLQAANQQVDLTRVIRNMWFVPENFSNHQMRLLTLLLVYIRIHRYTFIKWPGL